MLVVLLICVFVFGGCVCGSIALLLMVVGCVIICIVWYCLFICCSFMFTSLFICFFVADCWLYRFSVFSILFCF